MPQSQSAVHFPLLETFNWFDVDDARALRLLMRLRSSNQALEGLSRALESSEPSPSDGARID